MTVLQSEQVDAANLGIPATYEPPVQLTWQPSFGTVIQSHFDDSVLGSTARWMSGYLDWYSGNRSPDEPNFDPYDYIRNTPYEQYSNSFIHVRNRQQMYSTMQEIDAERWRQQQLQDVHFFSPRGLLGSAVDIGSDPTILLPIGEAARSGRLGLDMLRSAGRTAVAGAAASGINEAVLQATQETRTPAQSLENIGISTALSGALGALSPLFGAAVDRVGGRAGSDATSLAERAAEVESALGGDSTSSLSAAAATPTTIDQEALKSAFGVDRALTPTSPILRMAASPSLATRQVGQQLAEDMLIRNKNAEGIANEISVTRRVLMRRASLAQALQKLDDEFADYRGSTAGVVGDITTATQDVFRRTGGLMTHDEFADEVGRAMIRNDTHDIPQVQRTAQAMRELVFNPLRDEAIREGLLPPGVESRVADSYLMRLYNRELIAARRNSWMDRDGNLQDGFEDRIVQWLEGRQQRIESEVGIAESAVRAANARIAEVEERIQQGELADDAADRARANAKAALEGAESYREELHGLSELEPEELRGVASEVTDKILHGSRGLSYDAVPIKRGPLKNLTLTIPTTQIEDFLDTNVERVAKAYQRTMAPDIELTRMFGRPDMENALAKVRDSYAQLRKGVTNQKQLTRLNKKLSNDLRDISAIRDRVRGTYAMPNNPNGIFYRVARTTKTINFLRSLGGMVISSIPDAVRPMFVHGPLRVMRDGLVPMMSNLRGYRLAAKEVKLAGAALEMALDSRAMRISDVTDEFARHSRFERGTEWAAQKFGLLSLMDPWTVFWKQLGGVVSQSRTLEAAAAWRAGTISKKDVERLASMGIDEGMASRISEQFERHGEDQGTLKWANTEAWTDREAAEHYRAALGKEVNKIIVTPGQEKPLWMSSTLGSLLGQFQGFNIASMQHVLIAGLQQRDASALAGFVGMTMAGMLSYYLTAELRAIGEAGGASQYLSDDPRVWIMEGTDRGGALGYAFTADRLMNLATGGQFSAQAFMGGHPLSRYSEHSGFVGMLGPTVSGLNDLLTVSAAVARGNLQRQDIHNIRKMIPLNNVFYWRWVFDKAERHLDGEE